MSDVAAGASKNEERCMVLALNFKDSSTLRAAYMPFLLRKGFYIPTSREYRLRQAVYCLIGLPGREEKVPVAGAVAWIKMRQGPHSSPAGIGIQFADESASRTVVNMIEDILGQDVLSSKPTYTL